jgi:ATP phosphoribosyltransferase|tara:strand:+ start:1586 stop:2707 length:1122 start_codon:yes stop_codon:yes gene_type:complete
VRGEDVPFWVEEFQGKGKKVIGLTGEDLYDEYCAQQSTVPPTILARIPWNDARAKYGKPALCLLGPKDRNLEDLPKRLTVCIAAKYKNLGKSYLNFLEQNGYTFKKIYVNGCVEVSCKEGIADLVIDIVYTGKTLEQCGLKVYDLIAQSDFVILGSPVRQSIVFDMDGVLVDSSESYGVASCKTVGQFLKRPVALLEFAAVKQSGFNNEWDCCRELLRREGVEVDFEEIVEVFQRYLSREIWNKERLLVNEGTLQSLSSRASLGIVTGRPRDEAVSTLKKYKLLDYFEVLITRDDLSEDRQKPCADGLTLARKKLGLQEIVYVGDLPADAMMAKAANVRFVGVKSSTFTFKLEGAEQVLEDVNQILDFLEVIK